MKVTQATIQQYSISKITDLDSIHVIVDSDRNTMIIQCFNKAWQAYWSTKKPLIEFFLSCDSDYLAGCFGSGMDEYIIDLDAINKAIDENDEESEVNIDKEEEIHYCSAIPEIYGDDYWCNLPTKTSPQYEYLLRVINAAREGLKSLQIKEKE